MKLSLSSRRYRRITKRIIKRREYFATLSDTNLQAQTGKLRAQINSGSTLKDIMVDAYAVVCVADERVLGLAPFDNQILGAVAMEFNNIVEMKTGEGKTLTATMPMYLHGLTGPGNFLITANSYLANRDAEQMGRVYRWLGLTVMPGVAAEGQDDNQRDRQAIYAADIVYTTNSGLGFDYLFDNLAANPTEQFLHGFSFALLDEADAVLLDTASTPLIISGAPRVQSNLYGMADQMVKLLDEDRDYERSEDTKNVWFTADGIQRMERFFGITGLLGEHYADLYRHLVLALRANVLLVRNRNYVVENGEIILLDRANGRQLQGMKMQAGMHQAVEAKEHLHITQEQRSMASITYQSLFRMFHQLAGMTGTAKTDADEFLETYRLAVYTVPTHKPMIRDDLPDKLYVTNTAKLMAALDVVKRAHANQRPVLVETGSLSLSNLFSRLLLREGIPHNLLNARSAAKEAKIVAEAGNMGAVTVATSMAGRGTDIRLADGVVEKGGLLVLGTERMDNPRIDNQLRGRAGRQGDPGTSIFFTSLEDTVVQENSPRWVAKYRERHASRRQQQLRLRGRFKGVVNAAQKRLMVSQRASRFQTLQYGEVFRIQRESIYRTRNRVMNSQNLDAPVQRVIHNVAADYVQQHPQYQEADILDFIYQNIDSDFLPSALPQLGRPQERVVYLEQLIKDRIQRKRQQLPANDQWQYFQRVAILKAIDNAWIDQVDNLESLQAITNNRSLAQHNPIYEYQMESQRSYGVMRGKVKLNIVRNLLQSVLVMKQDGSIDLQFA